MEGVDNGSRVRTDEEVHAEEASDEHPRDGEEGGARVVVAHRGVAWDGGVHRAIHDRVPIVACAHHVEPSEGGIQTCVQPSATFLSQAQKQGKESGLNHVAFTRASRS